MTTRRFPVPWSVVEAPGGYRVKDATGRTLGHFNSWDDAAAEHLTGVLTREEAKLMAEGFAGLQDLLSPELSEMSAPICAEPLIDVPELRRLNLEQDSRGGTAWSWLAGIIAVIVAVALMYGYTRKNATTASVPSSPSSRTTNGAAPTTPP